MKITDNCVVAFHYTLTNAAGELLDSSSGGAPLTYLHGGQGIIPGLERQLVGMEEGDERLVVVQPEDGYGDVNEELITEVPIAAFEGIEGLTEGMTLQAEGDSGEQTSIVVRLVGDEQVVVDGNHPLAGEVLQFDVTIATVRQATDEEIAHGHVH